MARNTPSDMLFKYIKMMRASGSTDQEIAATLRQAADHLDKHGQNRPQPTEINVQHERVP